MGCKRECRIATDGRDFSWPGLECNSGIPPILKTKKKQKNQNESNQFDYRMDNKIFTSLRPLS